MNGIITGIPNGTRVAVSTEGTECDDDGNCWELVYYKDYEGYVLSDLLSSTRP